jgi:sarcosine oxidase subunit beta
MQAQCDVAIVGAGITGTAAAYYLSKAGQRVIVLERGAVASEASGRTLGGVRQSARDLAELPLAMEAVRLWGDLAGELGQDVGYRRGGNLRLGITAADVAFLEGMVAEEQAAGLSIELVRGERLRALAPELSPAVCVASYCPSDGYVADPPVVSLAFAQAARQHGATICTECEVLAIETAGGRVVGVRGPQGMIQAPTVLLATGIGTVALCEGLGLAFPMYPLRTQIAVVRTHESRFTHAFGTADTSLSGCPDYAEGCLRLSGGARRGNVDAAPLHDLTPSPRVEAQILERARDLFTNLADSNVVRRWCGLIDTTPDDKPVLDALDTPRGLVLAAGFSGHGFCLGPISGRLIAEMILTGRPSLSLDAFRWSRFAIGSDLKVPSSRLQGALG